MFGMMNGGLKDERGCVLFFLKIFFFEEKKNKILLMGWHGLCQPSGKIMVIFYFF